MSQPDARRATRLSRVRGLLLGLALGDAVAAGDDRASGALTATVTTQLACFTSEAVVRMWVRGDHKGIGPALGIHRNAYRRWARIQGIGLGDNDIELDGWLHEVPRLARRRGNAPAVVTALQRGRGVEAAPAPATSGGHHALTLLLPGAVAPWLTGQHVRQLVAATHGAPEASAAAVLGVALARAALDSESTSEVLKLCRDEPLLGGVAGAELPLSRIAAGHDAVSALRGGVALLARCPEGSPDTVRSALLSARRAGVPAAVGPVAGALLGAVHGVGSLPVDMLDRLDVAWVVDTLARDLVAQDLDKPGGSEFEPARDAAWWSRYPGG
ncbi:hypothetical protein [Pseudonocardia xishanensis]